MDYLSILGLLGLVGAIIWGLAYAAFVVLILVPVAIFILVRDSRERKEADKYSRDEAEKFLQKYKGHTVEYYYLSGTCMVDYNKVIRTKLIGMDDKYFLFENGQKLRFIEIIHPVD